MAEYTENYNLTKQGDNEYVEIDVINDNLDIIDQAIAEAGNNPQLEIDVAEIKDKIGSTADTGGSSTVGSVFAKLNYLVSQVSSYLSNIYSRIGSQSDTASSATSASNHAKLNWFLNLFGKTDDTGGTKTSGTVMGKLNEILIQSLAQRRYEIDKDMILSGLNFHKDVYTNLSVGETEILNISGAGFLYGIWLYATQGNTVKIKVYVDGELIFDYGLKDSTSPKILVLGSLNSSSYVSRLSNYTNGNLEKESITTASVLKFNSSLKIVTSATMNDASNKVEISYLLS